MICGCEWDGLMVDYKTIHFSVDFEYDNQVLAAINHVLSEQPQPFPFVESNLTGLAFHFHTLDLNLLEKAIDMLAKNDLLSAAKVEENNKAKAILQFIYNEVNKIGSYGIKSGKGNMLALMLNGKCRIVEIRNIIGLNTTMLKIIIFRK